MILVTVVVIAGATVVGGARMFTTHPNPPEATASIRSEPSRYASTAAEWASLSVAPVSEQTFRAEHVAEGKIAVNEDSSTPIFSPYAGRVTRLLVKPSDRVERGQPLFIVEATDTVQGLNDFVAAFSALNTAHSKLNLAQIVEKRADDLYAGKAVPLKDWQQSQNDLTTSQNDMRSAETALEAAHDRLRILGRTEDQISTFQQTRQMSADTPIYSPISGTVIQRKVGPGQFLSSGATDPVFVIGDLSTVWLTAFVRETEAEGVALGQEISFSLLALPDREFKARIDYVAAAIDPPASGPRDYRQQGWPSQTGDVRQCNDLFGRQSPLDRRAEAGADLRRRSCAPVGRSRRQVDRAS
jgi:membrane fusion protein, heavy metal efflux system